jgi:polysaccharide export outer membrane protein
LLQKIALKRRFVLRFFLIILVAGFLFSCKSYKQHYMFKIDEEGDLSYLSAKITVLEKNYIIQPNDLLELRVFTNKGERLIDPNFELRTPQSNNQQQYERPEFLVLDDGTVNFPMIGVVKIEGLRLDEAQEYLQQKYDEFYKDSYVTLRYLNKRVVVLGAPGGQVIPLESEGISVIEVLALAGGIDEGGKAQNLRLIRGDLHDPEVFLIDLSTINGMKSAMTDALPGDILYVEPTRKIAAEAARDVLPYISIITSALTLVVLISSLDIKF